MSMSNEERPSAFGKETPGYFFGKICDQETIGMKYIPENKRLERTRYVVWVDVSPWVFSGSSPLFLGV